MSQLICKKTKNGIDICFRHYSDDDENLVNEFFYSLSDDSLYQRFFTSKKKRLQERLKQFMSRNRSKEVTILSTIECGQKEKVIGIGQYFVDGCSNEAEVALMVSDDFQNLGIGTELVNCLIGQGRNQGLFGFTAEVLAENTTRLQLFEKLGFEVKKRIYAGIYLVEMSLS